MSEPQRQITASPISAFTSFGEAAPSPQATVAGNPAQPVDIVTPLIAGLENLSSTVRSFFNEEAVREDQRTEAQAATAVMEQQDAIKELQKAQKDNALTYAALVDKGMIDNAENPWARVGAMKALAALNSQEVANNLKKNLIKNVNEDADGLLTAPEPEGAVAKYLGNMRNPMGLSEDILSNYYYSINFEKDFSNIRQSVTDSVIKLRLDKDREDTIAAVEAGIVSAFRDPPPSEKDFPEGAQPLEGAVVWDPKVTIAQIASDPTYRAALGSQGLLKVIGGYLIELGKNGDTRAVDALMNTKLSSGQTLLESSNEVRAEFATEESRIASAIQRKNQQDIQFTNEQVVRTAQLHIASELFKDPNSDLQSIAEASGGSIYVSQLDGQLYVQQIESDDVRITDAQVSNIRDKQRSNRFQQNFAEFANNNPQASLEAALVGAAQQSWVKDKYVDTSLKNAIQRDINLIFKSELSEEDKKAIGQTLTTYRIFESIGNTPLSHAYFNSETRMMMYLLDALEKGDQGIAGNINAGSGNIDAAIQSVKQAFNADNLELKTTNTKDIQEALSIIASEEGFNPGFTEVLKRVAAIRDFVAPIPDMTSEQFAKHIIDHFTMSGNNYRILTTRGVTLTEEDAESYFDDVVHRAATAKETINSVKEPIAALLQRVAKEQADGEMGTDEYKEYVQKFVFVHSGENDGGFRLVHGRIPQGDDYFRVEDFRREFNQRVEIMRSANPNRAANTLNPDANFGSFNFNASLNPEVPGGIRIEDGNVIMEIGGDN